MVLQAAPKSAAKALDTAIKDQNLRVEDVAVKASISVKTVYKVLNGASVSRLTIAALKTHVPRFAELYDAA
jgi:predicted transcriptional regulator